MRFDPRAVSLATYFAILLFNVYILNLYLNGQLILYIHPRYVLFTGALDVLSLVVCGVGFVLTAWHMAKAPSGHGVVAYRVPWRPSLTFLVAVFVLVAAFALPARTLSSGIADQRSANFNSAREGPSGGAPGGTLALFGNETSRLTIADWVSAFNLKTSASFYEGKEVDVVGFVFQPKNAPSDVFYVSRFKVTCCAVDAAPLGLPVYAPGWQEEYEANDWVRVAGSFAETEEDIAEPAIVAPRSIEPTEQPENPYVN